MVAKERFQMEIKNMLLGACVLTRYNNRLYRVDDVDFSLSPSCTFSRGAKDETVTYKDYYKQQYNLTIKDMTQPLLLSKIKKRQNGMEVQYF
jgi:aubergine